MCAGQVLGARMATLGCQRIGIDDPRGVDRKKLIVWVEIDRCMADAVSAVTGARLGQRSLKYMDYGKVAATFLNLETGNAVRVVALESSRALADQRFPEIDSKKERQFCFYKDAPDADLFRVETVTARLTENDLPGHPRSRVICSLCGEGINDGREVIDVEGRVSCQPCAHGSYYSMQ
ncbi:MAG TPA: FmdE family protein [Pyrinomonadaceae bacterium]|nr:FmdE family protein [Pyrinomonadaceae bacterium]